MGYFSTLFCTSRPGPSGGTSPGQGEQPRAVTKPDVVPRTSITIHPHTTVHLPSVTASSLTATNQGQVVNRGPAYPFLDLTHSLPHPVRGKQPAEETQ